jgi:hypothetical protein
MMITSTLLLVFLISSFTSTISLHIVYAQNSNNTGLGSITNLIFNGKTIPIKYNITAAGKLLALVEDNDKPTLVAIISSPSDKGTLTIEVPRNIADDKFTVHVDGLVVVLEKYLITKQQEPLQLTLIRMLGW